MDTIDKIRSTLSAVRRRSTSEAASDALDPQRAPEVPHEYPSEEMQRAAAPEGENHHGVHDPAERDRRAMHNIERAAHARAPVDAVLDPMTGDDARRLEWFVTGPSDPDQPSVESLMLGNSDGGMEGFVLGDSADSGEAGDGVDFDDPFNVTGGDS